MNEKTGIAFTGSDNSLTALGPLIRWLEKNAITEGCLAVAGTMLPSVLKAFYPGMPRRLATAKQLKKWAKHFCEKPERFRRCAFLFQDADSGQVAAVTDGFSSGSEGLCSIPFMGKTEWFVNACTSFFRRRIFPLDGKHQVSTRLTPCHRPEAAPCALNLLGAEKSLIFHFCPDPRPGVLLIRRSARQTIIVIQSPPKRLKKEQELMLTEHLNRILPSLYDFLFFHS